MIINLHLKIEQKLCFQHSKPVINIMKYISFTLLKLPVCKLFKIVDQTDQFFKVYYEFLFERYYQ